MLVEVGDGVPLVGSRGAMLVGDWICITVPVLGVGVPPVDNSESMLVGVRPSVAVLVDCSVTASVELGLPVGSTVLSLLVLLIPVKMCEIRTYTVRWPFCVLKIGTRFASLPVVTVLVGEVDGIPLAGGGEATLAWPCVIVPVVIVDRVLMVGSGVGTLVGVWPCVAMPVGVVDEVLLVGSGEAVDV